MKAIKIVEENSTAIEEALKEVNGRSTDHAYTRFFEVAAVSETAEEKLGELLYKKDFPGAVFTSVSGHEVPNSYRGSRNATSITIERRSGAWYLTTVSRVILWTEAGKDKLFLTPEQHIAAVARFAKQYHVAG